MGRLKMNVFEVHPKSWTKKV